MGSGDRYQERDLIRVIARLAGRPGEGVVGIGDDCAVLPARGEGRWLATTDTLVEGVHFDLGWHPPRLLGRKAVAVNASDIAAMGGVCRYALLALALPARLDRPFVDGLLAGVADGLASCGARLVGGDTVASPAGLALTVTLLGEAAEPVLRSGARAGDRILVAGVPGRAAAGLDLCRQGFAGSPEFAGLVAAHLDPVPQVALGRALGASGRVRAMQDLSDGLATDLAHICRASNVAAIIDRARLPQAEELARAAGRVGGDLLAWQLSGGEDFLLVCAVAPAEVEAVQAIGREHGTVLHDIGRFERGQGVWLDERGGRREISFQGYEHLR